MGSMENHVINMYQTMQVHYAILTLNEWVYQNIHPRVLKLD